MRSIKAIARLMFPSEDTLVSLYERYVPSPEPKWIGPALYAANAGLLLGVWALILYG